VLERDPAAVFKVAAGAREQGVLVRPLGSGLAVSPPLTANDEHFGLMAEALAHGLGKLQAPAVGSG
jgi:putrescine---pyruvate transaminase